MAVGNVIGSNVFNVLSILGFSGLVRPLAVDAGMRSFDIPFMVGTSILLWPLIWTGRRISRGEGLFMLALYAGYTAYRVLSETARLNGAAL